MTKAEASEAVREAAKDLDAIRPMATSVSGNCDEADAPIRMAMSLARERFRQACIDYVASMTGDQK